jgi:hypothetical protein
MSRGPPVTELACDVVEIAAQATDAQRPPKLAALMRELVPWSSNDLVTLKGKPRRAMDRKHAMASKHATESLAYGL